MKRFMAMLLILAIITGMIVMPASAVTMTTEDTTVCPHCNTPWDACNWTPWVAEDTETSVPSGHYYLDEMLDMTARYKIGTSAGQSQELAVDVCIDLRGNSMNQTTSNTRAFYVFDHSTLTIMDTVGGGKVIGTGKGNPGGTIYTCANATVQLYSGTLSNTQKNRTTDGGVVYVAEDGNFELHGGIVDASGVTVKADNKKYGGAIYSAGNVEIRDGLVLGGSAYLGGTIYTTATGSLEITGGTVMNGTSTSHGGSLYNLGITRISGGLITGGYAPKGRGGNLYSSGSAAQLYISGGVIENGQADSAGGNVAAYGGTAEITGGTIRGNVYAATDITLSGAPVINHYDYEGITVKSGCYLTVRNLTEDANIILQGDGAMTEAATSPNIAEYLEKGYVIPASRYGLKVTDGVLTGNVDGNGYCPHCGQEVTWSKYTASTTESGHYYTSSTTQLPEDSAGLTIAAGTDIVLNLISGGTQPAASYQVAGSLSILSTVSSAKRMFNTAATTEANGATFYVTGTLNLYDGILGPAANTDTVTTGEGGVIYVDKGTLNIYGGMIMGASAAKGGAICLQGTSSSKQAKLNMHNGVITGGTTTGNGGGGNIIMEHAKATVHGGLIWGGNAYNGANLYNDGGSSSVLTVNGGVIAGGTATNFGGNLYHSSTSSTTTVHNVLIYGGVAKDGGNAYINNGVFQIYGGSMLSGVANSAAAGNIRAHAGKYYIDKDGDTEKNYVYIGDNNTADQIPAPRIIGGTAKTKGGNVCATGNLKLGKCQIAGGKAEVDGDDVILGDVAYMTVEPGFDGRLVMSVTDVRLAQLEENRELSNTVCTAMNGKLYVKNFDMAMLIRSETDSLALAGAALVDTATEVLTWYTNAQEAVDACDSNSYIRLYAPRNTIEMSGDTTVDLNGSQLTATGSGRLYGFDSANDTYKTYGSATVTGPSVEPAFLAPNGNQYVTVTDGGVTSFHRLGNTISYVSLRPAVSGMYYQGAWEFDDVLKDKIQTFGIALSANDMPGADFATDKDTMYIANPEASLTSGQTLTSVLVKNILKDGEDNSLRSQKKVYAIPYAVIRDGSSDDLVLLGSGVDHNLQWVVKAVDRIWPKCTDSQRSAMKAMYGSYADTMATWGLYNMEAEITGQPSVRPLKVLTIGNSTDVDALHMLNLVAAAQGYDQELVIGVLYYSGCKIAQHVQFLQNNEQAYALYISSTLTPDQPAVRYPGYTMYDALRYEDWDIIIIHEDECAAHKETVFQNDNLKILMDYIDRHKLNPDVVYGYHLPWVGPADPELLATYPKTPNAYENYLNQYDNDRVKFYMAGLDNFCKYVQPDERFVYIIPGGTALINASTSFLTEKDLHWDYYHASDLGRVLVAYTWYCSLTGLDHLDEVKLDAIPMAFLRSTADKTQDRALTEAEKQVILESVNNALTAPLEITQSAITTAP